MRTGMDYVRPKSLEDRQAAKANAGQNGLLAGDWRVATAPRQGFAQQRPVFGRARQLHLRAKPASHQEELHRAQSVATAACEAVAESISAVQEGAPIKTAELVEVVEGITASLVRDPVALPSITRLRQQHEYTYMHSVSVCGLMIALAQELRLEPAEVRDVGLAGLLHDIGKATIPAEILDRPGALTHSETLLLRDHPVLGAEVLSETPDIPGVVLDVCTHHHERPDGKGFPFGLTADALSIPARMAAICDFYDKATCPPAGAEKWSPGQAIEYLRASTSQFDEKISAAFIRMIGTFLPGVLVRLSSDRLGVILDDSRRDSLHPVVAIFQHSDGRSITWQRLATKTDPIICIERPETWRFENWPVLRAQLLALSE